MPAGFQVFNDDNVIQIDQDYRNVFLKQKISVDLSYLGRGTQTNNDKIGRFAISFEASNSHIVAIRSTQCYIQFEYSVVKPNVIINYYSYVNTTGRTQQAEFFVYDFGSFDGNVGLQVFTANGDIAYTSNAQPLKITGFRTDIKLGFIISRPVTDYGTFGQNVSRYPIRIGGSGMEAIYILVQGNDEFTYATPPKPYGQTYMNCDLSFI